MNAIIGFSDLLIGSELNEDQKEYVLSVRQSGNVLLSLINDILDLSKIEANKLELNLEPAEIRTIIQEIKQIFTQKANEKGLAIEVEVDKNIPHMLILDEVRLPAETAYRYPHELSGGMRQRIMLASALSCGPSVLILDEPTTALDVSIQKHILDLIKQIQQEKKLTILFITHDFSVVNMIADEVCVMRKGRIVERGGKDAVLNEPRHEYTKGLIACIPRLGDKRDRLPSIT